MREVPELGVMASLRWQLFCTLTFRQAELADRVRLKLRMAFIREVENSARVPARHLLWCCREERGEKFGRLHFHLLIGGLPEKFVHMGSCFKLMRRWEGLGGGMARIRVFDPALDGLDYMLKGLSGGDAYESGKFAGRSVLTLSESTARVVRKAHCAIDGPSNTGDIKADNGPKLTAGSTD